MSTSFELDPSLLAFASKAETESFGSLSIDERQVFLTELDRRLNAWRIKLPHPTREQMLATTHEENRMHVRFGHDTQGFWEGLQAEWRSLQKPDFLSLQADDAWSQEATEWLEQQRRSGKIFRDLDDANRAYSEVNDSELTVLIRGTGDAKHVEQDSEQTIDNSLELTSVSLSENCENKEFLADYVHIKTIGEGAFAVVTHYKVKTTGTDVAVKQLKDEQYAYRFEREITLMQTLDGHPNISRLISYECKKGSYRHITLKADTNLYKYIKKNNSNLTLRQRIVIFDQVLAAVSYAHSRKILHRDIAPTNVLVYGDEHIEVCDFGMGKDLSSLSNYTTSLVARYGQVYYVAPEQHDRLKDASERSDIYSLGKLLNFILTGRNPDVIHFCDFSSVIEKATQYQPDDRYQTVIEFEKAYNRLKSVILPDVAASLPRTLVDLKNNGEEVSWREFHNLAARGGANGHPYHDYIEPVIQLLTSRPSLREYYEFAGDSFGDFLRIFISKLRELDSLTGWPFKETTTFGGFLRDVFLIVREPSLKLSCLREIWKMAYEQDQWGVQSIMGGLLLDNNIPEDIQPAFAAHILDSSVGSLPDFSSTRIPKILRQALNNKQRELSVERLRRVLTELNEDGIELLLLFSSARADGSQFEHPFLRYDVYGSVESLTNSGVLTKDRNTGLGENRERISLVPDAVELIEELIINGRVQRNSVILDHRNIGSSGAGGSGAPAYTYKPLKSRDSEEQTSSLANPTTITVNKNQAVVEDSSQVIVALNEVFETRNAAFTITFPGKEPQQFPDVAVGNVWRFERGVKKFRMVLLEASFIKKRAILEVRLDPDAE